jgi:hypothetical protein
MSETTSHKRVKGHAAGISGETEKKIKYGGRIDVLTPTKAVEIERGGGKGLQQAVRRLECARRSSRILKVPEYNFEKAIEIAKRSDKKITVTNLVGTRRRRV